MYGKSSRVRFQGWGGGGGGGAVRRGISVCFWRWSRWISVIWAPCFLSSSLFLQVEWLDDCRGLKKWPTEVPEPGGELRCSWGGARAGYRTRIPTRRRGGGGGEEGLKESEIIQWRVSEGSVCSERGGRWIPSMQAAWNGWGSSGLSARCPRARETGSGTAWETRTGSAATPPPLLTGRREPAACPLRNPTAPARRSRPLTMTPRECCSEAESRRWSARKAWSTAGQVSQGKCLLHSHFFLARWISMFKLSGMVIDWATDAVELCFTLRRIFIGVIVWWPVDLNNKNFRFLEISSC